MKKKIKVNIAQIWRLQWNVYLPNELEDVSPHPLVKHLDSVAVAGRKSAEGKQAGWISSLNSKGFSNLRIAQSLSLLLYGWSVSKMTWAMPRTYY